LEAQHAIVFGHRDEGMDDAFVGYHIGSPGRQLALQLDPGLDHLDGIGKEGGAHGGQSSQNEIRGGHVITDST